MSSTVLFASNTHLKLRKGQPTKLAVESSERPKNSHLNVVALFLVQDVPHDLEHGSDASAARNHSNSLGGSAVLKRHLCTRKKLTCQSERNFQQGGT